MKHNLWLKNNNTYQSDNSEHEKGNFTTMIISGKKKPKRVRSAFTTDQVNYLEREYKKYPYIGTGHRKEIATSLNIPERTVKIWFQNRRMKEKKETISKEFCDELTGRQQVEFAKSRLNNVIALQSANDQPLNSSPLLTPNFNHVVEPITTNNAFDVKIHTEMSEDAASRYLQKPILQKHKSDQKLLTYFKSHGLPKDLKSTRLSIDTCKKFMKINNNLQTKTNEVGIKKQGPSLPINNSTDFKISPEDLSTKKTLLQPEQNTCTGYGQGVSGFVPVVPNFYPQPFVTPGGVLWKPVNIMSVMPRTCPTSNNVFNAMDNPETVTKACNCNCHSKSLPTDMGLQNTSPQYVLTALHYPNPSTKF